MRVLLLTQFFDPEPTLKGLTFARGLAEKGHDVRVLTGFPNYPSGRIADGYALRPHSLQYMDGIRVDRVFLHPSHDSSRLRRASNYASFAASSSLWQLTHSWKPDVVWVHHPPITAAAAAVTSRALRGVPFVLEIQDLWPDSLLDTDMVGDGPLIRAISRATSAVYRRARAIICISTGMKKALVARGVPTHKVQVIYNWADEDRLAPAPSDVDWARRTLDPGFLNVIFTGNAGPAQGLDAVLSAMNLLTHRLPQLRLTLVGGGLAESRLRDMAHSMELRSVAFIERQPMERIGGLLQVADAGIVSLKGTALFAITIPSKTQAYMARGTPIVMAVAGDGANMVIEAGAGVTATPDDPRSIADAIVAMAEAGVQGRRRLGEAGRAYYSQHLSLDVGLATYDSLFRGLHRQKAFR